MTIRINILDNLKEIETKLRQLPNKTMVRATRKAIKRTIPTAKRIIREEIKKHRALTTSVINKKLIRVEERLKGRELEMLHGSVGVRFRTMSRLNFVRGSKTPKSQRGIRAGRGKVKRYPKRRKIRVMVHPGKVTPMFRPVGDMSGAFIAKGRNNNYVLFRRDRKSGKLRHAPIPSIHNVLLKPGVRSNLQRSVSRRFIKEFDGAAKHFLSKLKSR